MQVFDFSAAQRAAHAEEYADAVISMTIGYSSLSDASKKIERDLFLQQALETQLLRVLVDSKTTRSEFGRHNSEN